MYSILNMNESCMMKRNETSFSLCDKNKAVHTMTKETGAAIES